MCNRVTMPYSRNKQPYWGNNNFLKNLKINLNKSLNKWKRTSPFFTSLLSHRTSLLHGWAPLGTSVAYLFGGWFSLALLCPLFYTQCFLAISLICYCKFNFLWKLIIRKVSFIKWAPWVRKHHKQSHVYCQQILIKDPKPAAYPWTTARSGHSTPVWGIARLLGLWSAIQILPMPLNPSLSLRNPSFSGKRSCTSICVEPAEKMSSHFPETPRFASYASHSTSHHNGPAL